MKWFGVAPEERVLFGDQGAPSRDVVRGVAPAAGDLDQLVEPLVVLVLRLPEGRWIGGVDQHRDAQPRAGGEDRVEPRIVDADRAPCRVAVSMPSPL